MSTPTFRGDLQSDRIEISASQKLTQSEAEILSIFNQNRPKDDPIVLSKKTLSDINKYFVRAEETPKHEYSLIGKMSYLESIREFLCENSKIQRSYELTVISDPIYKAIYKVAKDSGFDTILATDLKPETRRNFKKFIGILEMNEGQETVNKFLFPHIKTQFLSRDLSKLENMAYSYFTRSKWNDTKLTYNITQRPDGKYLAVAHLNGEDAAGGVSNTPEKAKRNMFKNLLEQKGLLPTNDYKRPIAQRSIYAGNTAAKEMAETTLKGIGFLSTNEQVDMEKDINLIENILIANNPSAKRPNCRYSFQMLQHLGDAILKKFAGIYLADKNLDRLELAPYWVEMTSIETRADYCETIGLPKHLNTMNFPSRYEHNLYTNIFDATVAALCKNFPQERVYEYLKPVFDAKYKEIQQTRPQQ